MQIAILVRLVILVHLVCLAILAIVLLWVPGVPVFRAVPHAARQVIMSRGSFSDPAAL